MRSLATLRYARFMYQFHRRDGMGRIAAAIAAYQWVYAPLPF